MGKDYILKMFYYCFFILVILLQIIRMMQFIVKEYNALCCLNQGYIFLHLKLNKTELF